MVAAHRPWCLAGVEPKFVKFDGKDAKAFTLSTNVTRRRLNTGQRVTVYAMLYPKGHRGKQNLEITKNSPLAAAPHHSLRTEKMAVTSHFLIRNEPDVTDASKCLIVA